jgi:chorismate mutase
LTDAGKGDDDDPFAFDPADAAAGRRALPPDMRRRVNEIERELKDSAAVDEGLLASFDERLRASEAKAKEKAKEAPPPPGRE